MAYWKIRYCPQIDINHPDIKYQMGKIDTLKHCLNQLPINPAKQQELDELRIKREVMGTTAIEGNGAAIDELEHEGQISAENYGYKEIKDIDTARECLEFIRSD